MIVPVWAGWKVRQEREAIAYLLSPPPIGSMVAPAEPGEVHAELAMGQFCAKLVTAAPRSVRAANASRDSFFMGVDVDELMVKS
jgi:hypothetical protein